MTADQFVDPIAEPQATALAMARWVHDRTRAVTTYLFGSRARGDHLPDSDIDILIITNELPEDKQLDMIREEARQVQKETMPEASGVDVLAMTMEDFRKRRRLINNLAWTINKEGIMAMSQENLDYGRDRDEENDENEGEDYNNPELNHPQQDPSENYPDESNRDKIDWKDVDLRRKDSTGYASDIEFLRELNILDRQTDKTFGNTAQKALENAYKTLLGVHGESYPTGGSDGHNLRILLEKIRDRSVWPKEQDVPCQNYQYLTAFTGRQIYTHEHMPLDKQAIARDIPDAVELLMTAVEETERQNRPTQQ